MEFLRECLLRWPRSATDVSKVAATAGITAATLRRAREKLGVRSRRNEFSVDAHWEWVLPEWEARRQQVGTVKSLGEIAAEAEAKR